MKNLKENYPWLYRAIRTFIQTFISVTAGQLAVLGTEGLTRQAVFSICVSAGAAGLSAVMNIEKNGNPETIEDVD